MIQREKVLSMGESSKLGWDDLKRSFPYVREVFEQPDAIAGLVQFYRSEAGYGLLSDARKRWNEAGYTQVRIAGMGSSMFAGHIAGMVFHASGVPCTLFDASELLYYVLNPDADAFLEATPGRKVLYLLVSQSGESVEVVRLLDAISTEDPGADVWGITNGEQSTLAKTTSIAFFLKAGVETSVTSKTFCNSIVLMYMLGRSLTSPSGEHMTSFLHGCFDELDGLARDVQDILSNKAPLSDKLVDFLGKDVHFIEVIARGASLATAMQASLNIKETDKIAAECNSGGQFRHGPVEIIDKDFRCIMLCSDDVTRNLNPDMAWNIVHKWGGGKVVFITNRHVEQLDGEPRIMQLVHDTMNPFLAPVIEMVIVQLLIIRLAAVKGVEPGVFKYISKVTKEG